MPYDELKEYENRTDRNSVENVRNYFSIDEEGNLVYASTSVVTTEVGSNENSLTQSSEDIAINLRTIDYKSAISQYTTQMNFLIYLTMISENPEFVSAVTDLIKDSKIEITLMDSISNNVNIETYTYTVNTRYDVDVPNEDGVTTHKEYFTRTEDKTEVTKITTETYTPTVKITYAKTWFSEQKIIYNKVVKDPAIIEYELNKDSDVTLADEEGLSGEETGTWVTNKVKRYNDTTNNTIYEKFQTTDVDFSRIGARGDAKRYQNGEISEQTFIGLMETKFTIPYSTRSEEAGSNIVSGAEMLFYLLQKDSKLENLEQIMRYALYLYTDDDSYGVTELDGSIFEIDDFQTISGLYGSNIEENVWFALRNAGYSEIATAAVMGNIANESGFNAAAIEQGSGVGFGLCQWSYGRRTALEAYSESKGVEPSDLQTQIEFLLAEINPSGGANGYASFQMGSRSSSLYDGNRYTYNDWKDAEDIATATTAFMALFERPSYSSSLNHLDRRIDDANNYYELFQGREAPTSDTRIGQINLTGENYNKMAEMLAEAIRICEDDSYTYSQENRYGEHQYDCSSFVYRLYNEYFGIEVPTSTRGYSAANQYYVGPVDSVELQPGDVLWRSGHVEIYIGNGLTAAAKSGRASTPDQIRIDNFDSSDFTYVYRFVSE